MNVLRLAIYRPPEVLQEVLAPHLEPQDASPTHITAILRPPNMSCRIKRKRNLIPQTVPQHRPVSIIIIPPARHAAHIKHLDDTPPRRWVLTSIVPVPVTTRLQHNPIRRLRDDKHRPRRMNASTDPLNDNLLVRRCPRSRVVGPAPRYRFGASVQRLAVRGKRETVVEAVVVDDHRCGGDAAVGVECVN